MSDNGSPNDMQKPEEGQTEHLNIKVTDNNNEVFFKIKRTTNLKKLMDAFCDRQGKSVASVRFLFDGQRVQPHDNPATVCTAPLPVLWLRFRLSLRSAFPNIYTARYGRRRHARSPPGTDWWLNLLRVTHPTFTFYHHAPYI
jgi:hypothetical protein